MSLNYELIEKWVKRLRSRHSKQARGTLKLGSGKNAAYCCLGHACVVASPTARFRKLHANDNTIYKPYNYFGRFKIYSEHLPKTITNMFGFSSNNPTLNIPTHLQRRVHSNAKMRASELNDTYEFSLTDIADCIEYTVQLHKEWDANQCIAIN